VAQWRWDGIDWDARMLKFWRPKVRDWHTVPLLPTLGVQLEKARPAEGDGYVFVGNNGREHVTSATVWTWARKVAVTVGVDRVYPRRFRHTVGTKVANATRDVQAAAAVMGNSVEVAARYYTQVADERVREGLEGLPW
jgi:integrase